MINRSPSLTGQLLIASSVLVPALQAEVDAITTALSWVVLAGDALVGFLFLWDALRSAPRHWLSVTGSGGMLLVSLLSITAYVVTPWPTRAHTPLSPLLLPLASSALIAGLYVLTIAHGVLNRLQRGLLVTLLVVAGLNLLGLYVIDLWGP